MPYLSSSNYLEQVAEWLKPRETDRDLFDVISEQVDNELFFSLEALRDKELKEINDEEEEWD